MVIFMYKLGTECHTAICVCTYKATLKAACACTVQYTSNVSMVWIHSDE